MVGTETAVNLQSVNRESGQLYSAQKDIYSIRSWLRKLVIDQQCTKNWCSYITGFTKKKVQSARPKLYLASIWTHCQSVPREYFFHSFFFFFLTEEFIEAP